MVDSLSRDFHRSGQTLTIFLNQILQQQTAPSFHIKNPPRSVIYWISLLAAASRLTTASPKPLQPSNMVNGIGGTHYSNIQESQTNSWEGYHKSRGQSLCHHSLPQCNKTSFEKQGNKYSFTELTSPPYYMYLRPSGCTFRETRP